MTVALLAVTPRSPNDLTSLRVTCKNSVPLSGPFSRAKERNHINISESGNAHDHEYRGVGTNHWG
jgi:hypothetical protein